MKLFFNPSLYFKPGNIVPSRWYQFIALIPYAMMVTKGNMIKKYILKFEDQPDSPAQLLFSHWPFSWGMLLLGGLVGGFLYWIFGIKNFASRLRWCGVENPNKEDARFVSIFSSLVFSLPGITILVYESLYFEDFRASVNYPGVGWETLAFLLMWWSTHVQWLGVKSRFNISGFKVLFNFYLLPFILQFIYIHQKFYLKTLKDIIYMLTM